MNTKLKICGMNHNTSEVAALQPDYLGFIFWEPSSRFFDSEIPVLPSSIKKVGVFVDETIENVRRQIKKFHLDAVQLHGKESPEYCQELRSNQTFTKELERDKVPFKLIKVFSLHDDFDFNVLNAYENVCDFYLFDTKGKLPGGNGYAFNWELLKNYQSTKPYFLSGGIGYEEIAALKAFFKTPAAAYCYAIDVNSKFETKPGHKNIDTLKEFKDALGLFKTPS